MRLRHTPIPCDIVYENYLDLRIERLFENQSCESLYRLRSSNWIPAQQLFKRAVTRLNLSSAEIRVTLEYFRLLKRHQDVNAYWSVAQIVCSSSLDTILLNKLDE
ncbi:hypothetical protein GJ496_003828 [Pomphorhynchus laevis]|nr:hypothetical protein GJ496_003828 [Pomphorhynchus laevis]